MAGKPRTVLARARLQSEGPTAGIWASCHLPPLIALTTSLFAVLLLLHQLLSCQLDCLRTKEPLLASSVINYPKVANLPRAKYSATFILLDLALHQCHDLLSREAGLPARLKSQSRLVSRLPIFLPLEGYIDV